MVAKKRSGPSGPDRSRGISKEERAALKERMRELRAERSAADGEREVLAKIRAMRPSDRAIGERIHALIRVHAPTLAPRTWYGMPAYSRGEQVLCFFRAAEKFGTRYATLGFSDEARLDDGNMWPTDFALTRFTPAEETRVVALLKRAVG